MKLYTVQYRYFGPDRLDITVKGKNPTGKIFAPTWKMVMKTKSGEMTWEEYKQTYRDIQG